MENDGKQWHYSKDGKKTGPISAPELKSLANSGGLLPDDLIWKDGMAEWKPAKNLKGLFVDATIIDSPKKSPSSPVVQKLPVPITPSPKSFVENAKDVAKGAAQYASKQAERTKLMNLTLPSLYQALGRNAFSSPEFRAEFAEVFKQLDKVQAELSEIGSRIPEATKSFGDKAKAMAGQAVQAAQTQKLSLQQLLLFGSLGKAVYEKHEAASGPQELFKPVAETVARLAILDGELNALSASKNGSWITPKRLAISVGAAACVLLVMYFMMMRGESSSYTQRVLDLSAAQKKEFGVNIQKEARPLFTPGSTEDFIQSLTMFKFLGNLASFNNHITKGDGSKAWGNGDSLNGIEQNCKVQFGVGILMKTKCWDIVYGVKHDLSTVDEIVLYGGNMSPGNMLVDRWLVNCTDEIVIVRGVSPKGVHGMNMKPDEAIVMFVHFDEPYKSIFPTRAAGGVVYFDY